MSKGVQIALAMLTVFAAIGWMVSSGDGSFQFFANLSELDGQALAQEEGLRVHGFVVEGSIARDVEAGHVDFAIRDRRPGDPGLAPKGEVQRVRAGTSNVAVRYDGVADLPDMFRDNAEVVVEGGFVQGRFVARKIMAKCPSKYEVAPAVPEQKT